MRRAGSLGIIAQGYYLGIEEARDGRSTGLQDQSDKAKLRRNMATPVLEIEELLATCTSAGLRKTEALKSCLSVLLAAQQPMTLQQIADDSHFTTDCDPATVYRLISRLEEHRIVRRVGFHSRAAHYCLRESSHQDYLICRDCGSVEVLDIACPVEHLEKQIAKDSGYRDLEHELEFYGRCQVCQED